MYVTLTAPSGCSPLIQLLAFFAVVAKVSTAALKTHPADLTVREGRIAMFNCTVQCSHLTYWAVGSLDSYNRTFFIGSSRRLENFKRLTGMTVEVEEVVSNCNTDGNNGNYIQQLRILAEAHFNRISVQCSAINIASSSNSETIFFSRYAVMTVLGDSTTDIPYPSQCVSAEPVTVTITSSMLAEPETVTSTNTVTVTATPSPVVVTQFVTVTVRLPSASPDPSDTILTPVSNDVPSSGKSRLLALSQLLTFLLPLIAVILGH